MPQIFRIGGYLVFFWINENDPLEPVHVHVSEGKPSPNATKIWNAVKNAIIKSSPYAKEGVIDRIQNSVIEIEEIMSSEQD